MRPKGCPAAKNGCLGGKAATLEAAGYNLNMATTQATMQAASVLLGAIKTALRFIPKQ
jgi:D-alanyl-D-alanine carboxypeptidase